MKILFLLSLTFLIPQLTTAQSADFIILKKNNKTIKLFYKGSNIQFVTTTGAYRDALITDLKNDSIFLQEFVINRVPTTLGFFIIDTVGSFRYAYNYKQIAHFGKENKKFNVAGSGAALLGGGIVLSLASGVVYLVDRKNFSPALLAAGAGLTAVGYLISKGSSNGITIGKKHYRLQYMNTNVSQK
ncbi:MAG: hypothetical protein ACKVOM_10830 [Ferruginibacter sp.]